MARQEGNFLVEDFYSLTGGLNTAHSPYLVQPTQATDGYNYDYLPKGAVTKRGGHPAYMVSADASTPTSLGFGLHDNFSVRTMFRAAGRTLKSITAGSFGTTALALSSVYTSDEASPVSNIFANGTTVPVVSAMFNTTLSSVLWFAGGAAPKLAGVYSTPGGSAPTTFTFNGASAPTVSAFTATDSGAGSGPPTGTYYNYTLTLIKASTGAESNALTGDLPAGAVASTGHAITLSWTLSGVDTTKYTQIRIYRSSAGTSAVDGNVEAGFTAGIVLHTQAIGTTTYSDVDTFEDSSSLVPRAGSEELDNSPLPTGVYNTLTLWQDRLCTSVNSSLYISETAKGESWPLTNYIQIPSEGAITGLASMSLSSGVAGTGLEEALVIFKEREVWAVTGTDFNSFVLTRVSTEGCPNQALIVKAGGNLVWVNYRGVFAWNGAGKPRYISQLIEDKFLPAGDIDKSQMLLGFGVFYQQRKQVIWYLSSGTYGTQQYALKLDLRLTEEGMEDNVLNQITQGIFSPDTLSNPFYAGITFTVAQGATSELLYLGDNAGQIYQAYAAGGDGVLPGNSITFAYTTPWLHLGKPEVRKNINKVVAWVLDAGQPVMLMDYWRDYNTQDSQSSTASAQVATGNEGNDVWDSMLWDVGIWDPGSQQIKGIAFFPNSQVENNASGTAFRFRFKESSNLYTPALFGFSVYYTEQGAGF